MPWNRATRRDLSVARVGPDLALLPQSMTRSRSFALAVALLAPACIAEDKAPEDNVPADDGKADSHQRPTDHGDLAFNTAAVEDLTSAAGFHAWEFALSADAQINTFTTYAVRGQRKVDTVMYLYQEGERRWGSYIARNDDADGTVWSKLTEELGVGHYRVLVKGYTKDIRGRFELLPTCSGEGCAPDKARHGA